jgi:Uma2 family endonuclease
MSAEVQRRIFNTDEYHRMGEVGILTRDDRVELIEGEIVEMSPIGDPHAGGVNRLNTILNRRIGSSGIVAVQNPIRLGNYSEPQPDIAVLRPRGDFYSQHRPTVDDVLLIVEVADSSISYDRAVKLPLYAKAGVPEVWLAALPSEIVEVHSQPVNGKYQKIRIARRGDSIAPEQLPTLSISVDEILG